MNPKTSGQTLCHTIPSLEMSTAVASSWEYEGMVDELNPLKGKIALIFLSENSIGDFSQHLFSEPFRNQWRGFKTKPDLKNPDDFVGQLDTFFGYDFLEDTKIALHCKVIRDLDSIDDYDFNGTGAAFIFGQFVQSNGTHDAVSKIMRNMGEESMVVDFTNSRDDRSKQKQVLIAPIDIIPQREVFFTLVLLRYLTDPDITILTSQNDTIPSSIEDYWQKMEPSDTDVKPVESWFLFGADVDLQFRRCLRDLKDSQTRIINNFDKEYLPRVYETRNARSEWHRWLEDTADKLDREQEILPNQEESMRKLLSILATNDMADFTEDNKHWNGVMNVNYDSKYDSSVQDWIVIKKELSEKYKAQTRYFYGHESWQKSKEFSRIAAFGDWEDELRATFMYNFSPYLWPHFQDLYLLHDALRYRKETRGTRTQEQQAWVKPTKFAKFNELAQHSKIRSKFREFKKAGGWLQ
jgi:hypothetical protein